MLRTLVSALRLKEDFVYETTLSSHHSIGLIRKALDADYEAGLVLVLLRDLELNVARVAQRVAEGGHAIPAHVIRRRYAISLQRLGQAIPVVHGTMVPDNSGATGPVLLLQLSQSTIEINNLDTQQPLRARLAAIVGQAVAMHPDAVMAAGR